MKDDPMGHEHRGGPRRHTRTPPYGRTAKIWGENFGGLKLAHPGRPDRSEYTGRWGRAEAFSLRAGIAGGAFPNEKSGNNDFGSYIRPWGVPETRP